MRVLLVGTGVQPIPPTGYGGVERTLDEFRHALESAGHTVRIVQEYRHGRSIDEYAFAARLDRLLAGETYDVLHASTPVVANRLARSRRPFVYTSHSRHWFEIAGLRQWWGAYLERRATRAAVHVIALTRRLADRMLARIGPSLAPRLSVVPIGVDTERFRPNVPARTGRRLVGVGIVHPMKRWELAAEATRGLDLEFHLVGPIVDRGYAERLAAIGPHVMVRGELRSEELAATLGASDVMVHPSRVELLAGAVLQGLAAGLPVLGAEPIAELVDPGVTGYTAPPGANPDQIVAFLRARLVELASDSSRRSAMADAARRSAEARFSWSSVVAEHEAIYQPLVDAHAFAKR